MDVVHVAAGFDPGAETGAFAGAQPGEAQVGRGGQQNDQVDMLHRDIAPAHQRTGQHPAVHACRLQQKRQAFAFGPVEVKGGSGGPPK
ncbi:MAG: hypothetical protein R3D85_16920 [Paracoccaceae bacterium]